ncbi:MAG TPA: hypothetical protein VIO61_02175 [Anaerolineaceae bacterium]
MQTVAFKHLTVSRFILGGNPFSGFSHQSIERNDQMRRYFTTERIKATLREAEALGVNTLIARADAFIIRVYQEHCDEGGTIQWFAQTCPEYRDHAASVQRAAAAGAKACYIHGGVMDNLYAQGHLDEVQPVLDSIRAHGMLAGIAAHEALTIAWAEEHLDLDFFMCSYYNPSERSRNPEHIPGTVENYLESDRQAMTAQIQRLTRPAIHYKILAAGRNEPQAAFAFAASKMRPCDAVCVGVCPAQNPDMLKEDVRLLDELLTRQY